MRTTLRTAIAAVAATALVAASLVVATGTASAAPAGAVKTDAGARLTVVPAKSVSAQFTSATKLAKKRKVTLQTSADGKKWKSVTTAKMNAKGAVTFSWIAGANTGADATYYRAVAEKFNYKLKGKKKVAEAVATQPVRLSQAWARAFTEEFNGSKLDATKWAPRMEGFYNAAQSRLCSAPYASNVKVGGGQASLKVSKASAARTATVVAKAKATQAKNKVKVTGCPDGVYDNATISTEGLFSMKSGVVAAKVKFPRNQGMHASVWLQSGAQQEIDLIESFGYGKGVTNFVHLNGVKTPASAAAGFVVKSQAKNKKWWSKAHVYAVEWNTNEIIFRIDGVETRRIKKATKEADYFVVISIGTAEWETPRIKKPVKGAKGVKAEKLPATMQVDWVRTWTKA